ncbi:hypothetical protein P9139_04040 [Curtobacterium flaccumfaciens]|nr:hypothetical protein P9139_04040 [Curtobacterium flaccumfaciens]
MTFRPGPPPPAPPKRGDAAAAAPLTDGEWHRMHPLTPLLKGGIFLIVILGYVLNSLRDQLVELFIPGGRGSRTTAIRCATSTSTAWSAGSCSVWLSSSWCSWVSSPSPGGCTSSV